MSATTDKVKYKLEESAHTAKIAAEESAHAVRIAAQESAHAVKMVAEKAFDATKNAVVAVGGKLKKTGQKVKKMGR